MVAGLPFDVRIVAKRHAQQMQKANLRGDKRATQALATHAPSSPIGTPERRRFRARLLLAAAQVEERKIAESLIEP
jgi:hypothetical protein